MSTVESSDPGLYFRLVDSLYVDAMVMADEARSYFDRHGAEARGDLDMISRLSFTCESLKVTTRLMHVIAWLLTQKAWQRGEIKAEALTDSKYRLGQASPTNPEVAAAMPLYARHLVEGSQSLYDRVARLQERAFAKGPRPDRATRARVDNGSPARDLIGRLEDAF